MACNTDDIRLDTAPHTIPHHKLSSDGIGSKYLYIFIEAFKDTKKGCINTFLEILIVILKFEFTDMLPILLCTI